MFSVIIPTMWVPWETFERQLIEMMLHPKVKEIIIIDNDISKTKDSIPLRHPKVRRLPQKENIFVNRAWNLGVAEAKQDAICLLNDDLIFDPNTFDAITEEVLNQFGIIGIDLQDQSEKIRVDSIEPHTWPFGFGCMMFMKKSNYRVVPEELKIMWGDSYLLLKNLSCGIGIVRGAKTNTAASQTVKSLNAIDQILKEERTFWDGLDKS